MRNAVSLNLKKINVMQNHHCMFLNQIYSPVHAKQFSNFLIKKIQIVIVHHNVN